MVSRLHSRVDKKAWVGAVEGGRGRDGTSGFTLEADVQKRYSARYRTGEFASRIVVSGGMSCDYVYDVKLQLEAFLPVQDNSQGWCLGDTEHRSICARLGISDA